jgi:alkylation response protein AidB-like acyl-CoA dehydrogenase
MKLVLTEEEQFLKDTAKNFAEERCPISHFRSLRDNNDPNLWDKDIWKEMTSLGWPGILIPEEYGGSNFGITGIRIPGHPNEVISFQMSLSHKLGSLLSLRDLK